MALIDDVKDICDELANHGWRDLFLAVTNNELDIVQSSTTKLKNALAKPLEHIDRTIAGFEDFASAAVRGATPGRPSHSLLYHAFASPSVHPNLSGAVDTNSNAYPDLTKLDTLENYIFSLSADRSDLDDTVVCVMAYQYRVASRASHLKHADLAYSRTGVARVGTAAPKYDPSRRSFWVQPSSSSKKLCVLPARYGVFLARKAKPGAAGSVQGGHAGEGDSDYYFPMHKLFSGKECLAGQDLSVSLLEYHRTEKLKKLHELPVADGGLEAPDGFDIAVAPYVRESGNSGELANLGLTGSSWLVVPLHSSSMVRTASQHNTAANKKQLIHFVVPRQTVIRSRPTRFATSTLEVPAFSNDRLAPEYVNIRHEIDPLGPTNQRPRNLNTEKQSVFSSKIVQGGYAAAHFLDDTCDGVLEAVVEGSSVDRDSVPAFSLITAPDFFPLADQFEMNADRSNIRRVEPLSDGRLPVNPTLPLPSNPNKHAFDHGQRTVTAIVGHLAVGAPQSIIGQSNRMVSWLPDAASNVFAPGWDSSRSRDARGPYLTSAGLGSPFPEDAKLCAALASFWPAVAPDNGRTFGNQGWGNQVPMLDEELGFHPKHERVVDGEVTSGEGWDGEFGPFFEKVGTQTFVNYVAIERSDYVSQAIDGKIGASLTAEIQTEDLIARHNALLISESVLGAPNNANLCLVEMRQISNWQTFGTSVEELAGGGFLLVFGELTGERRTTNDLRRVRHLVSRRHTCQVATNGIAYRRGSAAYVFRSF